MTRPACAVRVLELPAEKRPRFLQAQGVGSFVRAVGNSAGLTRMGVWLRSIEPGQAGTHRHWHAIEQEWAWVLSGRGLVRLGSHRIEVRAGHFVGFPPGPSPHQFLATGEEPLVLLEGGERRPDEETIHYPDLGHVLRGGKLERAAAEPEPEQGDPAHCAHVDERPEQDFQHDVDAGARRVMRSLHGAAGLTRQAVRWSRVSVGDRSTAYHTHDRTDEWVYILDGRARVRVGDARFEVSSGDFVGHAAGGPAHVMEPVTELTYLMGGMIDPDDVVTYPEAGVRRRAGRIEPLAPSA